MRPVHLALIGTALLALVLLVLVALRGDGSVLAAGPGAGGEFVSGIGPAVDLDTSGSAAAGAASATRTPIPTDEPRATEKPAAQHPSPRVRGRVVDDRGQGVAGARVWISTSQFWARIPLDLEEDALPTRWLKVERTECDAEGKFEFAELEPGPIRLAARSAGFAPATRENFETLRTGDVELPDVALAPGVAIVGDVLGVDGKSAADVRVLIAADSLTRGSGLEVPGRGVPMGLTGADGAFRVDELAPGPFHLLFLADGFALAELEGRTERAGEVQDGYVVRLGYGVEVMGHVVASGGDLPADLRVLVRRGQDGDREDDPDADTNGPEAGACEARPRTAPVGADGTFRFAGLRSGETYRLTLSQKRGETWKPVASTPGRQVKAPASGVEIQYKPESVVVLHVVDDATSQPIEDLVVWAGIGRLRVLRDDENEVQRAFPLGAVRTEDLRAQANSKPGSLRVSSPGYQDFERKDLRLVPGGELDLGEVRLQLERRIVATVVDADGNPVEGARVIVTTQSEENLREWSRMPPKFDVWGETSGRFGRTGADGTCLLSSLPGKSVLVQASARGFVPSDVTQMRLSKDADASVALKLSVGARVIVHVRDGAGRTVVGVPVGHRLPRDGSNPDAERLDENVSTDARGQAVFAALEIGLHAFRVQQEDGESSWWARDGDSEAREEPWQELTVANSADATLTLIAPPRGTLHGMVREGGRPLEGALVKLVPYVEGREEGWTWGGNGRDPFSATTDHLGEYRLENRRAGEYVVLVHHSERRMASEHRVTLGSGEQVQDFELDTNAIEGRITDPEGRPLVGVEVQVSRAEPGLHMDPPSSMVLSEDDRGNPSVNWRSGSGEREVITDSQGQYVLRGLAENTGLFVNCVGDEVENKTSEAIVLAPGEMRRGVDFVLNRAGRLRVELKGNLREDRWYQVSLVHREGDTEQVRNQAWLGNWNRDQTIGSIVPGTYVLRLAARDFQGNESPLSETSAEIEVGKLARASFLVP